MSCSPVGSGLLRSAEARPWLATCKLSRDNRRSIRKFACKDDLLVPYRSFRTRRKALGLIVLLLGLEAEPSVIHASEVLVRAIEFRADLLLDRLFLFRRRRLQRRGRLGRFRRRCRGHLNRRHRRGGGF